MSSPPSSNDGANELKGDNPSRREAEEVSAMERAFGKKRPDIESDTPTMRSVAILGPSAGPSFESGPKFCNPPTLKSFAGLQKPALGISRPPSLGFSKPAPLGRRQQQASFGKKASVGEQAFSVKQEWSGASVPSTWDVKGEDLEMVPWQFPLERTHREIEEDASCVASRITECLRKLSVEAEFNSEKAKAKCKTSDYVCFRIRLFAGGENGQPVIVEVQRRCGAASSFMRTCRALLNAAEGLTTTVSTKPFGGRGPPMPIGSMKCLANVAPKQDNFEADASAALNGVQDMLRSEPRDSNLLGLENLCALTDPLKTNAAVCLIVSKRVILGEDKNDFREDIRLLTERDVFAPQFDKDAEGPNTHNDHMRFLALCVLANGLAMCSRDGSLAGAVKSQRWFADALFPSLVEELKRADTSMNSACKAASCLRNMIKCCSSDALPIDKALLGALEKAYEVGNARHQLLAEEARLCLEAAR